MPDLQNLNILPAAKLERSKLLFLVTRQMTPFNSKIACSLHHTRKNTLRYQTTVQRWIDYVDIINEIYT